MANFKVPSTPNTYTFALDNLLGVDYNDTVVDNRRSPKMTNLVNNNGFLESRHGHKIVYTVNEGKNINGVWNIDAHKEVFVVHCGTELYEVSAAFDDKVLLHSGMADTKSSGIYINGSLIILDGYRAIIYHKVGSQWRAEYLDNVGYIPTVSNNLKPDGSGGKNVEPINQLSQYEIFAYLGDGVSKEYILPKLDSGWYSEEMPIVTKLISDGSIVTVPVSSWEHTTGKIRFANAIEKSPIDGQNNVFIKVKNPQIECNINKCTFGTLYGYGGANNRLFVSGNPDYPNQDWYSDDQGNMETYFPVENWTMIGTQPIVAYSRTGDGSLVVHKKLSDTDCTVYYRSYNIYDNKKVFPISSGVKNIGCLNHECCANFLNDPVFLSELGVYGLTKMSGTTEEKYATERSYYINRKLLQEENLDKATAIVNQNRYYLAINDRVYVADKRFLSTAELSTTNTGSSMDYQYEWFLLTDVPVRTWFNWNNKLYFGDSDGHIRTFDNTRYYDEEINEDGEIICKPYDVYYETPFLYLSDYTKAKTIRRLYVHSLPTVRTAFKLSYETMDGVTDVSTIIYDGSDSFPRVLQEKEKISKIMSCKLRIEGLENTRCSFSSILAEYRLAGKYRGE